jgi:hypothetical protein
MAEKMNIYQKIAEVQKKIEVVGKDAKIKMGQGSYKGVTHDAVLGMIREHCLSVGIIVSPDQAEKGLSVPGKTSRGGDMIRFEAVYDVSFINIDDPTDRHTVSIEAHADDSGDKAPGKAVSYATKTAELKVFMLKTGENDEARMDDGDNSAYYKKKPELSETQLETKRLKKLIDMAKDKESLDLVMMDINDAKDDLSPAQFDYLSKEYTDKLESIGR